MLRFVQMQVFTNTDLVPHQIRSIRKLLEDVVGRILLFVSHPTADLIQNSLCETYHYYAPYGRSPFFDNDPQYLSIYYRLFLEDQMFRKLERMLAAVGIGVTVDSRLYAVRKNSGLPIYDHDTDSDSGSDTLVGDLWLNPEDFTDAPM